MNLTKILSDLAAEEDVNFSFNGKPLNYEQAFADVGLLPAMVKRADSNAMLCLGHGLGMVFSESDASMLGSRVQFDDVTPDVLRIMFVCDVIMDMIVMAPDRKNIALDELIYG